MEVHRFLLVLIVFAAVTQSHPTNTVSEDVELIDASLDAVSVHSETAVARSEATAAISNTADLIKFLQGLLPSSITKRIVPEVVALLQHDPVAAKIVDGVIARYPALVQALASTLEFFNGPEAAPLMEIVRPMVEVIIKAVEKFIAQTQKPVEELRDVLVQEGVKMFIYVQNPKVMPVLEKIADLPIMKAMEEMAKPYGISIIEEYTKLLDIFKNNPLAAMIAASNP